LYNENQSLKMQVNALSIGSIALITENNSMRIRIESLTIQLQNQSVLIEQIEKLRTENNNLKIEIIKLKEIIEEHTALTKKQNEKIDQQNKKMDRFMKRQYDDALLIFLQDVNRELQLESKLVEFKDEFQNLRDDRNGSSHYIEENRDSYNLKMHKIFALVEHIRDLDYDIKKEFERKHGCVNVLDKIVHFFYGEIEKKNIILGDITMRENACLEYKLCMLTDYIQ
jgi:predicted  nucleic acid-binding Zn-ribbon protein